MFDEFPNSPVASASLGQVYKAKTKNNTQIAVKVQRPNLYFVIRRDVVILRFLATIFSPFLPFNIGVGIGEIIDEFGKALLMKLIMKKRVKCYEVCRSVKDNPNVFIPKLEKSFSFKRIITTSWIDGVKLRDKTLLEQNNLVPASFIKTCVISGLQQLFEYGYFHADPHPTICLL